MAAVIVVRFVPVLWAWVAWFAVCYLIGRLVYG